MSKSVARSSAIQLFVIIALAVVVSYPLRAATFEREMAFWYFDQATLDAGDCSQGYPCIDVRGADPDSGEFGGFVDVQAEFIANGLATTLYDVDGSPIGVCTADTAELTTYSATQLTYASATYVDAIKEFRYGAFGAITGEGLRSVGRAVESMGLEALENANMLLPRNNVLQAITTSAGWLATDVGVAVSGLLSGV